MEIKLNDEYRITADDKQYILNKVSVFKEGKNIGKENLVAVSYHTTLESLLKNWCRIDLRQSDCSSFKEVIAYMMQQNKFIEGLINE